jgi:dipeptidyl-peptidase-4
VKTGATRVLHTATDEAWLNIDQAVPLWLKDGSAFLWTTDQEEGRQLELIPVTGGPPRILIAAKEGFAGLIDLQENEVQTETTASLDLLCYLSDRDTLDRHMARATITPQGVQLTRLTQTPGIHTAAVGRNREIFIHRHTGPKQLTRTAVVRSATGELVGELPSVAQEPPFWPTTQIVTVGENPRWYASVTRPRQFDPGRKYPVIVQVYGGPTVQSVTPAVGNYFMQQWYADHGFIVVAIDNRGTPGRGRTWERAIYRDFGTLPLEDQVAALKLLGAQFPEMDLERVGIKGWSFGGYLSALAVLKRPDVFHAAVAGAPVTDWEDYDTHYTERYLGLPQENPAGYKNSSLLPLAQRLTRPLLLIHGSADDNVYFVHSLKLADALFRHGQPFELLVLKGQAHGVVDPQLRERLEERTLRFFQHHLAPCK